MNGEKLERKGSKKQKNGIKFINKKKLNKIFKNNFENQLKKKKM